MAKRLHLLSLFFFLCGLGPIIAQTCDCVSTGNCPVPIQDNGTYIGELDVTVNGPNDLGTNPLTSVCFTITHTWVGDLSVSLMSPNGTAYLMMADLDNNFGGCNAPGDNVQICMVPGTGNPLTNNEDYPSTMGGPCDAGLCMIVGDWTLACGGVTDPINNIPQAPNCNLTDFNQPGAPANGTWQLVVNDVCNQDTGTLDNFSLTFANGTQSCIVCESDGGQVDTTWLRTCVGDPSLIFNLPPGYGGDPPPDVDDYDYTYVLSQGGIILGHDEDIDLTGQPAGTYQLHGLSYLISDTADLDYIIGLDTALLDTQLMSTTAPFCADLSENFKTIIIEPAPAPVSLTETVCAGACANINGLIVCSDTSYTLASWLGCDSLIQVTLTQVSTTAAIAPASPPTLTCANPTATLDGSASTPATVSYSWSGPGTFSAATASVTVDVPGTYTLTVSENSVSPACTSTATITVMDGLVSPNLSVSGTTSICNGENFDLNTLTINDLNSTGAAISFHDGTPATAANELSGTVVSPTATTTYYILATSGNCSDEESVTVTVTDLPTANFSTDGPTCVLGSTTVTYDGNASGAANYVWDFGGGAVLPGTGPGPHAVTWPNSGTYTLTLTVEENGCTSAVFSEDVAVEAELAAPVISCNTTTSTVEFSWNAMPNGTTVNVLTSHAGMLGAGDTTYLVTGLSPNEEVIIEVTAIGTGACGNSVAQQSCTAQNCPNVTVDIDPVADICLTANSAAFDLSTVVTGGSGGTLTFSGDGITDTALGTFDPQAANIGANSVVATYTEGNCPFTGSININVFQTPVASFTVTPNICESGNATVTFDGTAPAGSTFVWDFDGGTATPGTGAGPHTVTWPTADVYNISLTVNSPDGCSDSAAAQSVTVDAPLATPNIICGNATATSVVFNWTADPAVSSYNVTSPSGHALAQIGPTSWEATGLTSSEAVEIEVEAVGTGACGNVTAQQICTSQDCPNVTFAFDPVATICADPTIAPFLIPATIGGTTPNGTLVWTGPGITNAQTGEFDPLQADEGENLITVTYTEGTCVFTENTTIEVYPSPQGSLSVVSPICMGAPTLVTFTGDPTGLIFDWNFGGGFPVNLGGGVEGPYEVSWSSTGIYTVSLYLYTQECFVQLSEEVEVQGPVQSVIPNCTSTLSTVEFNWDISSNATDYTVEVLSGHTFSDSTLTAVSFANLGPEEEVSIALILDNNTACPPDTVLAMCSTLPCPDLDLVTPNCTSTTNAVEFTWGVSSNATSYEVEILSGHAFTDSTMTSISFGNLPPEEEVSIALILGNGATCPPDTVLAMCSSLPCPNLDLEIQPVADFCLGMASAVPLTVNVVGSDGSGTGAWSGNGVDAANGTFDPMAASFGGHIVAYTFVEQGCTYQDSITINVYAVPTANFTADAVICILDEATVTFDGVAGTNANYTWDFDGGVANPGTGIGPHTVVWSTPGAKTISLSVEENGCASQIFTQNIQVDEALMAPMLNCQATTDSVIFTWADVPNATGYMVEVLTGPMGLQNGNTYVFSNLDPGQEVTIRVTVEGNTSCPFPSTELTCQAMDCPAFGVEILPAGPYCLDGNAALTQLSASVSGSGGNGTFTWSGSGVIDAANGTFDPNLLPVGEHMVTVVYTEVNCSSSAELAITMVAPPVADAGEDYTLSCWNEDEEYRLGGNATSEGVDIAYQWTMTTGVFPENASMPTPTVSEPGTYTLVVTNTELGCSATDEVSVFASEDLPIPQLDVQQANCRGGTDPLVSIQSVSGGMEPFLFSLDGAPYVAADTFPFLEIGEHTLEVIDANGCEYADAFTIEAPAEVSVELTTNLVGKPVTTQGEGIQLLALSSLPVTELDSIHWSPDSLLSCNICLDPLASPSTETLFWVTLYHNGCEATDSVRVYVERENPIYVPNAFSPNGDNTNDLFRIYPGPTVVNVKNFKVFDRWGEMVYERQNFDPTQPANGWDGTLDGKPMNAAVFGWFAEVELADGTVELLEGDVTLVK